MKFITHTQEQLKILEIKDGDYYTIEYLNHDYFNGIESIEKTTAKAIFDENANISFLVQDDYGMDKFIKDVRIII